MSKHTPGPWSVPHFANTESDCQCHYVFSESQSGFGCVAEVLWGGENENLQAATANAKLIAAAPDLLEALESVSSALAKFICLHDIEFKALETARKAIASAKGEA